jgi:hypothetical protein
MLHHPTGVARGQASDVHNEGRELLRVRDYMDATLSVATGRPFHAIQEDLERALYMSPQVCLFFPLTQSCCFHGVTPLVEYRPLQNSFTCGVPLRRIDVIATT